MLGKRFVTNPINSDRYFLKIGKIWCFEPVSFRFILVFCYSDMTTTALVAEQRSNIFHYTLFLLGHGPDLVDKTSTCSLFHATGELYVPGLPHILLLTRGSKPDFSVFIKLIHSQL